MLTARLNLLMTIPMSQPPSGRSSGVEHNLAKVGVESSNLFARSSFSKQNHGFGKIEKAEFLAYI